MNYQIGATFEGLQPCSTVLGVNPRGTFNPGAERILTLAGTFVNVGYPRATWTFTLLKVTAWALLTLVGDSSQVYVETHDDKDDWYQWRALMQLPEPRTLERWGGYYRNVTLEFVLLEDVTPES